MVGIKNVSELLFRLLPITIGFRFRLQVQRGLGIYQTKVIMSNKRLNGDPSVLVLGLLSVTLTFYGYNHFYGIPTLITLICGISAWKKANQNINIYKQSPDEIDSKSIKIIKIGKVLGIIGAFFSIIIISILILFLWLGQDQTYIEF